MKSNYIVTTMGVTWVRHEGEPKFKNIKTGKLLNSHIKKNQVLYVGDNQIKAEYIALKAHYDRCINQPNNKHRDTAYGITMIMSDIRHYENRYPEWCI
jgi:hypothetical protein